MSGLTAELQARERTVAKREKEIRSLTHYLDEINKNSMIQQKMCDLTPGTEFLGGAQPKVSREAEATGYLREGNQTEKYRHGDSHRVDSVREESFESFGETLVESQPFCYACHKIRTKRYLCE